MVHFIPCLTVFSQSEKDTIKYSLSFIYLVDLSDTYGGGEMFMGELGISRSWYGASLSYGHFMSQDDFVITIPVEETGFDLEIPFEEMAIMKMGTLSLTMIPIQGERFSAELLFGAAYARAEWSCFKSVDYSYDIAEGRFTSLSKDYQLVKDSYFGYQAGLRISYYPLKRAGLELNARIQDLGGRGTFFFVGGGFSFKL